MPDLPGLRAAYAAGGGATLPDGDDDSPPEPPQIDRSLKGPRLVNRIRPDPAAPQPSTGEQPSTGDEPHDTSTDEDGAAVYSTAAEDPPAILMARIYFTTTLPLDLTPVALAPWPGDAARPDPSAPGVTPNFTGEHAPDATPQKNETVAPKGEVTGAGRRPKSPAELLNLTGPERARHERCLADAIYFEARGEPVRGQMAVAQVVINRVFSGHYPGDICGVVYQSTRRHRRLRCQFSFTCDGIPDRIAEPGAWAHAQRIARDALDGKFWLNDIGKATHYHARWVHPRWVREMRRLDRIGVHTFYRPRRWGDGSGAPVWGNARAKL